MSPRSRHRGVVIEVDRDLIKVTARQVDIRPPQHIGAIGRYRDVLIGRIPTYVEHQRPGWAACLAPGARAQVPLPHWGKPGCRKYQTPSLHWPPSASATGCIIVPDHHIIGARGTGAVADRPAQRGTAACRQTRYRGGRVRGVGDPAGIPPRSTCPYLLSHCWQPS